MIHEEISYSFNKNSRWTRFTRQKKENSNRYQIIVYINPRLKFFATNVRIKSSMGSFAILCWASNLAAIIPTPYTNRTNIRREHRVNASPSISRRFSSSLDTIQPRNDWIGRKMAGPISGSGEAFQLRATGYREEGFFLISRLDPRYITHDLCSDPMAARSWTR